jgi:two-component system, NarL family, response regulator LiaR
MPYSCSVKRIVLLYGLCGGLLIAALKAAEYRFVVVEHSIEIYGGVIAFVFAAVGIWLGLTLTRTKDEAVASRVPVAAGQPFVPDETRALELGLTRRELDILREIAAGKSTREIDDSLFVSENTVKTHASRVFSKLNVRRRTQAVHVAKQLRLIP